MKRFVLAVLLLTGGVALASEMDRLLTPPDGTFWDRNAMKLQKDAGVPFRWGSRDRKSIRYARKQGVPPLTWLDREICEVLCKLASPGGKLREMTISIYNRGDAGPLRAGDFKKLQDRAENEISKLAGAGLQPVRDRMSLARETVHARTWTARDIRWQLLWCESDRGPEYLTLKLTHPSTPAARLRQTVGATADAESLPGRVKTGEDGRVYLEIPMIDQGDKGYCAAATVARVLQYYGGHADQNQIAQIIGTDAQFGTSWQMMQKKMEQAEKRLNVQFKMIYSFQDFDTAGDFRKFLNRYNRAAKDLKKERLKLNDFVERSGKRRMLNVARLNRAIDKDVYRKMRLDDKALPKFRQDVQTIIRQGLPLLWLIPGHIRLIVGFIPESGEILYSDSWGSGHEMKKMALQDAFVLTQRLLVLEPR